jgi:hypothetical protein
VIGQEHTGSRRKVLLISDVKKMLFRAIHHNNFVKFPLGGREKENVMAKLIAEIFERFGHVITHQRRRGALPKVAQGGG